MSNSYTVLPADAQCGKCYNHQFELHDFQPIDIRQLCLYIVACGLTLITNQYVMAFAIIGWCTLYTSEIITINSPNRLPSGCGY